MDKFNSLKDKVVIITGAGKGIGYETALAFAKQGAKIAAISRSATDLDALDRNMGLDGESLMIRPGDVSDENVVSDFINDVYQKFGKIDVLINNAGIRFRRKIEDIEYSELKNVMDVNFGSVFLFTKKVIPIMKKQKSGRIINMSSIVGTLGLPELSGYAASKGAIISFTKAAALELAEYNICVNAIAPGFCKTSYADNFMKNSELYNFTLERTPLKRWEVIRSLQF